MSGTQINLTQRGARGVSGAGTVTAAAGSSVSTRVLLAGISSPANGQSAALTEQGREGMFVFHSAAEILSRFGVSATSLVAADTQQGIFVAPASDTTGASGAWVRKYSGDLDPLWFGFVADGTTDNSDQMDALLAFLKATGDTSLSTISPGTCPVKFPKGRFYFSRIANVKVPVIFTGSSTQVGIPNGATHFIFATGGFVLHRNNTQALNSGPYWCQALSPTTTSADGSIFERIYCSSLQARPSDASYSAQATDGLLSFAAVQIIDCTFDGFTRHGINILTSNIDGAGLTGNADNSIIQGAHCIYNGGHGINLDGVDSNQISLRHCDCQKNNNWGIFDSGFLSNLHYDHHFAFNGAPAANLWPGQSKGDTSTSVVTYPGGGSGSVWYVNPGNPSNPGLASTTQPGTDPTVWCQQTNAAGTVPVTTTAPLWTSGIATKNGGSFFAECITSAMFVNLYCEGTQGQPYLAQSAIVAIGGDIEGNPNSLGTFISSGANGLTAKFGKPICAQYIDPTTGIGQRASLGFGGNTGNFLQYYHDTFFPTNGWLGFRVGADLNFAYDKANIHFALTGPSTTQLFGRSAGNIVPNAMRVPLLAVGPSASARIIDSGTAAPSTTVHAVGDIRLNSAPAASGSGSNIGWKCTAAGTPGTHAPFGGTAATSSATYVAATGGTTVDSQARASQVQLAADLADMKAKLQAAGLMV